MKVKNTIKAYTAGIVDGEGSIQINPSNIRKSEKAWWGLTVQISSGDKNVLYFLKKNWKDIGNITEYKARGSRKNRKNYNWRLYSKEAENFLINIFPYLIIKKEQAYVGLKFRKLTGFKKGQLTKDIIKKRKDLAIKIKKLNQKYGKGKITIKNYKNVI